MRLDLKGMMLNEQQPLHKVIHCVIPFIQHPQNDKTIEMENKLAVAKGQERSRCDNKEGA